MAFLWKALLKFGGRRTLLYWLAFFAVLFAAAAFIRQNAGPKPTNPQMITLIVVVGLACYIAVLFSMVMVGQQASAQLRQAVGSFDVLKTYPIPGWQIALGELLGMVALGTALQWGALGVSLIIVSGIVAQETGGPMHVLLIASAAALILPGLNLSMAVLPSAAALAFPGWFKGQDGATPGLENTDSAC